SRSLYAYGHTPGPHAFPTRRSSDLVTSDVPIYDPTISRRHAEVSLTDGGVKVKDAGSSNGTFLNGARITEAIAVENDVITFGKRSEEHTSELQSRGHLVCRLLLEKK